MPTKPPASCALCNLAKTEDNPVDQYPLVDLITGEPTGKSMPICRTCYDAMPVERDPQS